jgi:hypothetical protein
VLVWHMFIVALCRIYINAVGFHRISFASSERTI